MPFYTDGKKFSTTIEDFVCEGVKKVKNSPVKPAKSAKKTKKTKKEGKNGTI
jgi:hypothetical protein